MKYTVATGFLSARRPVGAALVVRERAGWLTGATRTAAPKHFTSLVPRPSSSPPI
jgi:hypothetical protein